MKRTLLILIPAISLGMMAIGCGGKGKPVTITSFKQYTDEVNKMAVRYPDGWTNSVTPGQRAVFYSSSLMFDAFAKGTPQGDLGAKIEIAAMPGGDSAKEASINSLKAQFTSPDIVKAPQETKIGNMAATRVSYGYDIDADTKLVAERFYVVEDGMVTYLETAVMAKSYDDYAKVFDTARASFQPAKPATPVATKPDSAGKSVAPRDSDVTEKASTDLKTYSGNGFSIGYPSNFSPSSSAGKVIFSGARNDSYIQIDAIDPKGMTLDKVVEQISKGHGSSPASIGGQKGYVINYSLARNVTTRAYFVMGASKLYRITMNLYTPHEGDYQPAFSKALGTFQAK